MSVTQYEIPCAYDLLKLKDTVFFLSKNSLKTITIDNGEAYVDFVNQSPYPPSPNRLKGFNVKLTETESLDERYIFTKQLTMSITGHLTDSTFLMDDDYYIVVQTEDGTYYLVNVDFPSKMSFVYNLSEGQDQTDFTFVSNSNHPTLKLNWNPVTWNTCQTYQVFGIDGLKLLEKDYTTIDAEQGVINLFDGHEFKDVDYLKNTISLQENYDGKIATTTITFEIPFDNYKPSWQYNLLEFTQNLYTAHITPKNSESGIFCGYEHGLQPSYEINGNASNGESTSIKITLTEASEWGIFELDTWSYYRDSSKRWIGVDSEHICVEFGIGAYLLMQEVDGNGTPTGRYKCLEGYENRYSNYNIVETYDEAPRFASSDCARSMARRVNSDTYYTCVDGNKYSIKFTQMSYDNKKTWVRVSDYELGEMVESGSSFCEIEPQYKWELSDEWECIAQFTRWIESGTTCILGNKYKNNYKQLSDDGINWYNSNPLEWSASTMVESASTDCISYRWVDSTYLTCVEVIDDSRYKIVSGEPYCNSATYYITYDSGTTWEWADMRPFELDTCIEGCTPYTGNTPSKDYLRFTALEDTTFYFTNASTVSYSLDGGDTWYRWSDYGNPKVCAGQVLLLKGNISFPTGYTTNDTIGTFSSVGSPSSNGRYMVTGNLASLNYGDDFETDHTVIGSTMFQERHAVYNQLFVNSTNLVSISGLTLEHVIAPQGIDFKSMFQGCTSLSGGNALCQGEKVYRNNMFSGCTSLTDTGDLSYVINGTAMFRDCTALSAITSSIAVVGCCTNLDYMFAGCTALTSMPSDLLPLNCNTGSYAAMFANCTSLTTAPNINGRGNYSGMFNGCTSLVNIPSVLSGGTYSSMFANCTSLTTVPSLPSTSLTDGCYAAMFINCTSLVNVPSDLLPATTFPSHSSGDIVTGVYESMFEGCTSLRTAPILPAHVLTNFCYWMMFKDCTSLTSVTCFATINSADWCTNRWLENVAPIGTFKASNTGIWTGDISSIPSGWTIEYYPEPQNE